VPTPARPRRRPLPPATVATSLAAAAALAAAPAARPLGVQDLTFTYRAQSTAAARGARQGGGPPAPNVLATVRMSGANARVDLHEGAAAVPMMQGGGYVLLRGADRQLVVVNPRERQAVVLAADALGAGFGALTNNALLKFTLRDARFGFEELGPGERIHGQPTRRVRIRSGGTLEMRVLGRTSRSTEATVTEAWIAPRPDGLDAEALRGWSRSFGAGLRRTNAELAAQAADYDRRYGDGLALRTVAVVQATDDQGRTSVDTVRMEVTELSRGRVDPAALEVPAGYQTVDARQVAASVDSARRARGDTGSLGDALRRAADQSIKDNATTSVKNAIGGLFGRRRP
jgi:hypothetical protein